MPPAAASPSLEETLDWSLVHPHVVIWVWAAVLWISVSMIARMWIVHRRAAVVRKIVWTVILLAPVFGWVFYAGFFSISGFGDFPPTGGNAGSGSLGYGGDDAGGYGGDSGGSHHGGGDHF